MFFGRDGSVKKDSIPSVSRKINLKPHSRGCISAEKSLNRFKEAVLKD